jgi:hypothetical protein
VLIVIVRLSWDNHNGISVAYESFIKNVQFLAVLVIIIIIIPVLITSCIVFVEVRSRSLTFLKLKRQPRRNLCKNSYLLSPEVRTATAAVVRWHREQTRQRRKKTKRKTKINCNPLSKRPRNWRDEFLKGNNERLWIENERDGEENWTKVRNRNSIQYIVKKDHKNLHWKCLKKVIMRNVE